MRGRTMFACAALAGAITVSVTAVALAGDNNSGFTTHASRSRCAAPTADR